MSIYFKYLGLLLLVFCSIEAFAQLPKGVKLIKSNLVENGDFSKGNQGFETPCYYRDENKHENYVMLYNGNYTITANPNKIYHQFTNCQDKSGNGNMMVMNGSASETNGVWSQNVIVKKNTSYIFYCSITSVIDLHPANLRFAINGEKQEGTLIKAPSETCQWVEFHTFYESTTEGTITISIVNTDRGFIGNCFALDDIGFYECTLPNKEVNDTIVEIVEIPIKQDTIAKIEKNSPAIIPKYKLTSKKDLVCGERILLDKVNFRDNSAEFKGKVAAKKTLNIILLYMKEYPNTQLTLYGHTDIFGDKDQNLELSKQRVMKVQRWLSMAGIDSKRMDYKWYGADKPLVIEGDISNRRVEIKMTCEK